MRDCGAIIEAEIVRKKVKRKLISEYAGMSPQNLSKVLKKKSIEAELLEKFCQYLGLDPMSFFDYRPEYCISVQDIPNTGEPAQYDSSTNREVELLERLLEEKDARISDLERTIQILLKDANN